MEVIILLISLFDYLVVRVIYGFCSVQSSPVQWSKSQTVRGILVNALSSNPIRNYCLNLECQSIRIVPYIWDLTNTNKMMTIQPIPMELIGIGGNNRSKSSKMWNKSNQHFLSTPFFLPHNYHLVLELCSYTWISV